MTVNNSHPKVVKPSNNTRAFYKCFQNFYHCHSYLDLKPSYYTDVRPSANHWQLRDMLQADENGGRLFYARDDNIRSLDIKSPKMKGKVESQDELTLEYLPRCFNQTNGGYIVTGGLLTSSSKVRSHSIPNLNTASSISSSSLSSLSPLAAKPSASNLFSYPQSPAAAASAGTAGATTVTTVDEFGSGEITGRLSKTASSRSMHNIISYSSRSSRGALSFHNPHSMESHTVALGDMINNSVTIYQNSSSNYTSYVCNNDSNLYVVDIDQSRKLSLDRKINCELNTSLNNVVRCPISDKVLTITGDSSSIFLVDPTSASTKIATIKTKHDSGFGVSYHPNGTTFAVTFQDGHCLLYDIRNLPRTNTKIEERPLYEFKSTRAGHQNGAFRCCKFSQTGLNDMLVISEHVGRVHLIDLKKCNDATMSSSFSGSSSYAPSTTSAGHQVMVLPFALDQYGHYKVQKLHEESEGTTNEESLGSSTHHYKLPIYEENDSVDDFPVPLVYDYDYLVDVNPHIFKDYTFEPECDEMHCEEDEDGYSHGSGHACPHEGGYSRSRENSTYLPPPQFNIPIQRHSHSRFSDLPDEDDYDYYNESSPRSSVGGGAMNFVAPTYPCHDHISANANHINGEINLSGIDWYGERLLIGCEDGGILSWDMNTRGRKSSGNFAYV